MIVRRATEDDGGDKLFDLVRHGMGHESLVDPVKLWSYVREFCKVQGDCCAMLGDDGGKLVSVAAGFVVEHPWLIGKQLHVIALTGPGGLQCLRALQEWSKSRGATGEFLTLNPDKRYDRWARTEGYIAVPSYWRQSWQ